MTKRIPNPLMAMVATFHQVFKHPIRSTFGLPDEECFQLRCKLLQEELEELSQGATNGNLIEFLDGAIDSLYVIYGFGLCLGAQHVWPSHGGQMFTSLENPLTGMPSEDDLENYRLLLATCSVPVEISGEGSQPAQQILQILWLMESSMFRVLGALPFGNRRGFPIFQLFSEVHRSNMSKLGPDGLPIYNEHGKVMKGPEYSPPNLEKVLLQFCSEEELEGIKALYRDHIFHPPEKETP